MTGFAIGAVLGIILALLLFKKILKKSIALVVIVIVLCGGIGGFAEHIHNVSEAITSYTGGIR